MRVLNILRILYNSMEWVEIIQKTLPGQGGEGVGRRILWCYGVRSCPAHRRKHFSGTTILCQEFFKKDLYDHHPNKNAQGVGYEVVNVKPAVGEEVLQHFCAGREEKSQEEPQPGFWVHGRHKEGPWDEDQGVDKVVATDADDHDIVEIEAFTVDG